MLRSNENKKCFGMIVAIVVCLAVVSVARADWLEQVKLLASDGDEFDEFGGSVSISGDYTIVGAKYDEREYGLFFGSTYIFKRSDVPEDPNWPEQVKLMASDGEDGDFFGWSVSISTDANYVIVGAYDDEPPSVYIFKRSDVPNDPNWYQQAKLTASDGLEDDEFGHCVSVSCDYALVGAYFGDGNDYYSGAAYVFKRDGASWSELQKFAPLDGETGDHFGQSVSISGDYAIVGAAYDNEEKYECGSAYIFKRSDVPNDPNWYQQAKLTASDAGAGDLFGISVSLSGDYAMVGAWYDDDNGTNSGSAYIFKRDGESWVQQAKLTACDGAPYDFFGYSGSISGNYAVVGAHGDDHNGNDTGSAYIFKRNGTCWIPHQKLTASDGAAYDCFGYSVSISGEYAIIGARYDDDNGDRTGSAYVFKHVVCPTADLSGDCWVDFEDFAIMAGEWLQDN